MKKTAILLFLISIISLTLFFISFDFPSKQLKVEIESFIKNRLKIDATYDELYISLIPPYIGVKGLTLRSDPSSPAINVSHIRAYLDILYLLDKKIVITKLMVNGLLADLNTNDLKALKAKISLPDTLLTGKSKNSVKKENFSFDIKSILISDGHIDIKDSNNTFALSVNNFSGRFNAGFQQSMKMNLQHISFYNKDLKAVKDSRMELANLSFDIEKNPENGAYRINDFTANSEGLALHVNGAADCSSAIEDCKFSLNSDISIQVTYLKSLLGLKNSDHGKIEASGRITYNNKETVVKLDTKGSIHLETFMELTGENAPISGPADFNGEINGPLDNLKIELKTLLKNGYLYGVKIDRLTTDLHYDNDALVFLNGDALLYGGTAKAESTIKLFSDNYFSLNIDAKRVSSSDMFDLLNWNPGISEGEIDLTLFTEGDDFYPEIAYIYKKTEPSKESSDILKRIDGSRGEVSFRDNVINVSEIFIYTDISEVVTTGEINIADDIIDLEVSLLTEDIADITMPYSDDFRGPGSFRGKIDRKSAAPHISGIISMEEGSLYGIDFSTIEAEADYTLDRLKITKGRAALLDGLAVFNGNVTVKEKAEIFNFNKAELNFDIDSKNLALNKVLDNMGMNLPDLSGEENLSKSIKGSTDLHIALTGSDDNISYKGNMRIKGFIFGNNSIGNITSQYSIDRNNALFQNILVKKGQSVIESEISIMNNGNTWSEKESISYEIASGKCLIHSSDTPLYKYIENAVIECKVNGKGSLSNPILSVETLLSGGAVYHMPVDDSKVNITLQPGVMKLDGEILGGALAVKGSAAISEVMPWALDIEAKHKRYDFLVAALFKNIPEEMILYMTGNASFKGTRNSVKGELTIPRMNMLVYDYDFTNSLPLHFHIDNNFLSFQSFALKDSSASLSMSGDLTIKDSFNLSFSGTTPLRHMENLSDEIEKLDGISDFELHIIGPWKKPDVNGWLEIKNGLAGLKNPESTISDLQGELYFNSDRIIISKLNGKYSGGEITSKGRILLEGFKIKDFYIDAELNDIYSRISDDFDLTFGGNLLMSGDLKNRNLSGELFIDRASYKNNFKWGDWLFEKGDFLKRKSGSDFMKSCELNVRIVGDRNIIIDNNIAESEVSADMILRGTLASPTVFGRIESRRGKVYFRNNEFDISKANVDFIDEYRINPFFDISAETSLKGYKIRLSVTGRLDQFNMAISSSPHLDEMDILSLLTVGEVRSKLKGMESDIGTSAATSFLTGMFKEAVEDRVRGITGLDRFRVSSHVSEESKTISPQVTLSKKLLSDKFYVTLTSSVGTTEEEEVIKVEYIFNDNVSVIGERDEIGSIGGDLRFRFEFK